MIAFLDTRHPEDAPVQFLRSAETPLDAGPGVRLDPQRVPHDSDHGGVREPVLSHPASAMLRQEDRFHDVSVAVPAIISTLDRNEQNSQSSSIFSAAMKASCGISTLPNWRIRFLPAFCFSSSFFLRVASPP